MDLVLALGAVLKERRSHLRLSQDALAELAGVHVNFVSLVERGEQAMSITSLAAIAAALRVRPSKLIALAEEKMAP